MGPLDGSRPGFHRFEMPYASLTDANLADDFWTIRLVEQ